MTITDFLLARVAEDEDAASKAGSFTPWERTFDRDNYGCLLVQPSRVLAECAAKREIVERCFGVMGREYPASHLDEDGWVQLMWQTMYDLAEVYADHPDYREEWRL